MKAGAFRYDIDHITTRIIPGPKHYVAQLNLLRAKERRKPQDIRSINQPFNPDIFNFTQVGPQELVFNLKRVQSNSKSSSKPSPNTLQVQKAMELEHSKEEENGANEIPRHSGPSGLVANGLPHPPLQNGNGKSKDDRHALVINVSPMEYGHCLLLPQVDRCLPQIVTETSIKVALEMLLLSKHRGYRLGFNSLCAFASVNHLHFHAFYLEHELVVEYCPVTHLAGDLYEINTMPVPGFGFQLHGSTVEEVSRQVHQVSSYFQEADIAHNLFICRGTVFGETRQSTKTTVRVYIWPRRKFVGTKSAEEFNVASIELGGHLPIRELDGYHSLTEEAVDAIIADSQLPAGDYEKIKKHVIGLFSSTSDQPSQ
ncbi:GDP-D-glucose phosphorylase 1-like isoform X2 [Littorina saxatilis]